MNIINTLVDYKEEIFITFFLILIPVGILRNRWLELKELRKVEQAKAELKRLEIEEVKPKTDEEIAKDNLLSVLESCSILLNVSDTFAYATSDSEEIDGGEFMDLVPYIEQFGGDAVIAYVAVKREIEYDNEWNTIIPTKEFRELRRAFKDYVVGDTRKCKLFYDLNYMQQQKNEELSLFGERVKYTSTRTESGLVVQIHYLPKSDLYGIGSSWYNAREDLKAKHTRRVNSLLNSKM